MYIHIVYMYIQSVFFPNPHDSSPNVQAHSKSVISIGRPAVLYQKKIGKNRERNN